MELERNRASNSRHRSDHYRHKTHVTTWVAQCMPFGGFETLDMQLFAAKRASGARFRHRGSYALTRPLFYCVGEESAQWLFADGWILPRQVTLRIPA
jgi:hypothetical protein